MTNWLFFVLVLVPLWMAQVAMVDAKTSVLAAPGLRGASVSISKLVDHRELQNEEEEEEEEEPAPEEEEEEEEEPAPEEEEEEPQPEQEEEEEEPEQEEEEEEPEQEEEEEGEGENTDIAGLFACLTEQLTAAPETVIANAELALCLPGLLTDADVFGLFDCVGTAIGCDQAARMNALNPVVPIPLVPVPPMTTPNGPPGQRPQPEPEVEPEILGPNVNTLGDVFDGLGGGI